MTALRPIAIAALFAVAGLFVGCDPELPGRACSTDDDCFRDEICQGTSCVSGARDPEPEPEPDGGGADADLGPDGETG